MEFKIYTVPFSAYPRVHYACKHLEPLLRRYNDLTNEIQLEKWTTPIEMPFKDRINKQTFQLCLQSLDGDRDIDIRNVTKQNHLHDCITEKCATVKELAQKRCIQKSFVVIIASDIKEDDIPEGKNVKLICLRGSDNQKATKGMQIVSKEHIYKTVSELMELNLYKASEMKNKCECLLHILDAIFHVEKDKQKVSSLKRSKSEDNMICRTDESTNDLILERSTSYMEKSISEGTERGELYTKTFIKKLRDDLNKSRQKQKDEKGHVFLKQLPVTRDKNCLFDEELIQKIERLSDEMLGMFSRSSVPKNERPQLGVLQGGQISKQLKKDLHNISPSIRSCGYRGCTLVIFVDKDCDLQNLKSSLKNLLLRDHNIVSFSVEPLNIKEFCKVGSEGKAIFSNGIPRYGTLGGFGYSKSCSGKGGKTIGLVSRHVFNIGNCPATCALIHSEGKTTEASVDIDNSFADNHEIVLDIAAISFKEDKSKFDTTYKTSENKSAKGVLTTYTTEQMKGLPVQICGAWTPLGRGTVTMPKIEGVRDRCMDENFIFVEDDITEGTEGKEKEVFCKELDSGAIVCTDDQDNPENVQLISMVIGESIQKKGSYATLKLKEGINQVEEETNSTIKLL